MTNVQKIKKQSDELVELFRQMPETDRQRILGYTEGRLSAKEIKNVS